MFVMYEKDAMRLPVKVWLEDKKDLEETCREQAYHLAQLPFLHKWVNLMPDTHAGMGMPIGGVIAAEGVIIPNAVGVDIGCGCIYGNQYSVRGHSGDPDRERNADPGGDR